MHRIAWIGWAELRNFMIVQLGTKQINDSSGGNPASQRQCVRQKGDGDPDQPWRHACTHTSLPFASVPARELARSRCLLPPAARRMMAGRDATGNYTQQQRARNKKMPGGHHHQHLPIHTDRWMAPCHGPLEWPSPDSSSNAIHPRVRPGDEVHAPAANAFGIWDPACCATCGQHSAVSRA